MATIRSANRRHKRAIAQQACKPALPATRAKKPQPAKAAS